MGSTHVDEIAQREKGLSKAITAPQMAMIGIGSAIGTGLFLGSGIAIANAGPGVLISYAIAAIVALTVMWSLTEMTLVHPVAGSFGAQAEHYLGGWAGFVVRFTYWAAQVIAIGGEATAIALYMRYWFPSLPASLWIALAALTLICINCASVRNFGTAEYWFTMVKVVAIVAFIAVAAILVFGRSDPHHSTRNLYSNGGFLPHGLSGVWSAVLMAIFSFYGVEVVAVTAGETADPDKNIPRAFRLMLVRLVVFYLLALTLMMCLVPWQRISALTVSQSPFVLALKDAGLPFATGVMNFVVLTAALSSMNSNLYVCTRMIFSLARSRKAPQILGRLNQTTAVPIYALAVSSVGMLIAFIVNLFTPAAFNLLFGITIFGGLFVWVMILMTFFAYRRHPDAGSAAFRSPLFPVPQLLGIFLLCAILVTMLVQDEWRFTWFVGVPFLIVLSAIYYVVFFGIKTQSRSEY